MYLWCVDDGMHFKNTFIAEPNLIVGLRPNEICFPCAHTYISTRFCIRFDFDTVVRQLLDYDQTLYGPGMLY